MSTDTMEAGRELDALVAENVMGRSQSALRNIRYEPCPGGRPVRTKRLPVPHYSTDIAAAWLIVEKLLEQGIYPTLECVRGDGGNTWYCDLDKYEDADQEGSWWPVEGSASLLPLAICRAALKAVGA